MYPKIYNYAITCLVMFLTFTGHTNNLDIPKIDICSVIQSNCSEKFDFIQLATEESVLQMERDNTAIINKLTYDTQIKKTKHRNGLLLSRRFDSKVISVPTNAVIKNRNNTNNSSPFNLFLDTDGDSVDDAVDIDDDNDGVPDAIESPACFYKPSEAIATVKISTGITSSTVNSVAVTPGNDLPSMRDGISTFVTASNHNIPINQLSSTSTVIYKVEYPTKIGLTQMVVNTGTGNWGASSFAVLEGSVDDISYEAVSSPLATTSGAAKTWTVTQNTQKLYKYYRIRVSSVGTSQPAITNFEVTGTLNSATYNMSAHPKPTCTDANIDADNIPPHRDLDTDGDGCSDSVEGGNTPFTSNNTTTYNSGTDNNMNGLLDQFENGMTGTINYTSTHTAYAATTLFNACQDADGDAVQDLVDVDDDNDGVTDDVENGCGGTLTAVPGIIENADFTAGTVGFYSELDLYDAKISSSYASYNGVMGYTATWNPFSPNGTRVDPTNNYLVTNDIADPSVTGISPIVAWRQSIFLKPNTNYVWLMDMATTGVTVDFQINNTSLVSGPKAYNSSSGYSDFVWRKNEISFNSGSGGNVTLQILQYATNGAGAGDMGIDNMELLSTCPYDIDTDNDGIVNRFDLDTDGDGCPDTKEAILFTNSSVSSTAGIVKNGSGGAVTSTITADNAIVPGPYGSNGFADAIQSSTNANAYKYVYTYRTIARSASANACKDTDEDGASDLSEDIDADNDGIPNAVEAPACFFTEQQAMIITDIVTSDFTWNATNNLLHTYDQSTSTFGQITPSTGIMNKALITFDLPLVEAAELESVSLNVGTVALGTGTWQLEGLNVNNVWTPLSAAQSMNTINTTYVFSNSLAPGTAFYSYRILGVSNASVTNNARLNEFTLQYKNYQPSQHIISTGCATDTDGDFIINFLDRDSDGDGCPDAVESNVNGTLITGNIYNSNTGSISTSMAVAAGPYGDNGLANQVESPAESGILTYTSTYDQYAIKSSLNFCTDTDDDAIADLYDIDDDNDGIVDAVESPSCFFTSSEASTMTSISTPLTNDDGVNVNLPFMSDGVTTSVAASNNVITVSQAINGAVIYNIEFPTIVKLTSISHYGGTFGTSATAKIQGSNDKVTWVEMMTSPTAATATTKTFTVNHATNAANSYRYYRIVKAAGTTMPAITSYEISAVVNTTGYNPSSHPKVNCSSDVDGDMIPNYRDLDTDGDGCADAIEGGGGFSSSNLVLSAIDGGNTGSTFSGNPNVSPIKTNLGNTVDANGVPTIASGGQAIGNSQTKDTDGDGDGFGTSCDCYDSPTLDSDSDGVPDLSDVDVDNDGIANANENINGSNPYLDGDSDGIHQYLDDNDADAAVGNANGKIEIPFDTDGDGVPNHRDQDSDNDGIPDVIEACSGVTIAMLVDCKLSLNTTALSPSGCRIGVTNSPCMTPLNTDVAITSDVLPDFLDLDSDQDGCSDTQESFGVGVTGTNINTYNAMLSVNTGNGLTTSTMCGVSTSIDENLNGIPMYRDADENVCIFSKKDYGDLPLGYPIFYARQYPDTDNDSKPDDLAAVWLGEIIDFEDNNQPSDDSNGDGNDEDGLQIKDPAPRTGTGRTGTWTVTANGNTAGTKVYLSLRIDWNNDKLFANYIAGSENVQEIYLDSVIITSPVEKDITIFYPESYETGSGVRNVSLIGAATKSDANKISGRIVNGEIEDYQFGTEQILPITLLTFEVQIKEKDAYLKWVTLSEIRNDHFEVEKSANGQLFYKIGEVKGSRTIKGMKEYRFRDENLQNMIGNTVVYYRLKQVDEDGVFSYSQIKSVNIVNALQAGEFRVLPNITPPNSEVTLIGSGLNRIEIYDMMGRLVQLDKFENAREQVTLNIQMLKSGLYFIYNASGQTTKLIVVE